MKTIMKKSEKDGRQRILRSWTLIFSFMMLNTFGVMGNGVNTKNTLPAAKDDEKASAEEVHHQELMAYVYMAIGLGVIFGVAGFTVAGKRKKAGNLKSEKKPAKNHRHSTFEKRYGTSKHKLSH